MLVKVIDEKLLKDYLNIRYDIFVIEKEVPESIEQDEFDILESKCDHYIIVDQGKNVGAIRIKKEEFEIRIQRFCIYSNYRNQGIGKKVVKEIEDIYKNQCIYHIVMDAKYDVYPFYERCGYKVVSDVFEEANIPHVKMEKDLLDIKMYDHLPIEAKQIRTEVFMKEQGFVDEFDDLEDTSIHLVFYDEHKAIGTCRYYKKDDHYILGRIAIIKEYRGKKIGAFIVSKVLDINKGTEIVLHAQMQAKGFYEKLGFISYGEIEYEEHCPHIWMKNKNGKE